MVLWGGRVGCEVEMVLWGGGGGGGVGYEQHVR